MAKIYTYNNKFLDKRHNDYIKAVSLTKLAGEPGNAQKPGGLKFEVEFYNGTRHGTELHLSGLGGGAPSNVGINNLDSNLRNLLDVHSLDIRELQKQNTPFKVGKRYYSIVSYTWPDYYHDQDTNPATVSKWNRFLSFGDALGIGILNRNSGNWDIFDNDFKVQGEIAKNKGVKRLVFYVKTQYGAASGVDWDGRANIPDKDKYTKDYIMGQIEKFKTQYGDLAEGVFLDEVINGWGESAKRAAWYKDLIDSIKFRWGSNFFVVCNCGANIAPELLKWKTDVFMTYEGTAEKYLNEDPGTPVHTADMAKEPGIRFWHVVHGCTPDNYRQVFAKAAKLGIGHVYVTDGRLDESGPGGQWQPVGNPYENPPSPQFEQLIIPWINDYLPVYDKMLELEKKVAALPKGGAPEVKTFSFPTTYGLRNTNLVVIGEKHCTLQLGVQVLPNAAQYGVIGNISDPKMYPKYDLDFMVVGKKADGSATTTKLRVNANGKIQYMEAPPTGVTMYGTITWGAL
jgi:hypothetical protein|nr:MAG TPA: Spherulation-specific family 4 [Caudoviricetes sp.]